MGIKDLKSSFNKKNLFHQVRLGILITTTIVLVVSAATSHYIRLTELEMSFDDLPESFDGYKVAVIADLHLGLYTKEKQIDPMFVLLEDQNPDFVVIVGDHIFSAPGMFKHYNPENTAMIERVFRRIVAKYPTYAVNGNHDNKENKEDIIAATISSGVVFLDNRYAWITNANNSDERIYISGVGDLDTDIIDFNAALKDTVKSDFSIMLSHNPKAVNMITNGNYNDYVDLMLAGHTHGGQINIPIIVDHAFKPAHKYGLERYGNTELYVTSGVGMSFLPIRFNATAEVAIITLKATNVEANVEGSVEASMVEIENTESIESVERTE